MIAMTMLLAAFRTAALVAVMFAPALAAASAGRDAITRFSTDLRSLDGRFAQQVFDANGTATDRSEGRISLKAPRQFRWEYQQPYPQLIVADGDHLWLYDPDLEQVTVRVQSYEEQSSPLAALIDPGELDRQFVVAEGGQADGLTWVDLKARKPEDSAVQSAKLGFNASGLAMMVFEDQLGQRTEVTFSQWKRNGALPADLFRFTPPEGVDVVGDTRDSAEVRPLQE
jgi:outer membrane lipoprotein carrier protein